MAFSHPFRNSPRKVCDGHRSPLQQFAMSRPRFVDLVCIAVLTTAFLAIALPRFRSGIDWGDEGFLAYGAVRVMEGQMPNRDFVSLQPPFSYYLVAAAFKFFGTSLATLRVLGVAVFWLIALSVYGVARMLMPSVPALAAALPATVFGVIFNFVPFAVWQGILFSVVAVWFYLYAFLRKRHFLALLAGLFTTLTLGSRHEQGLYLTISIAVFTVAVWLVKDSSLDSVAALRTCAFWLLGAAIPGVLFLIFWSAQGALPDMWHQLVVFPLSTYRKTSSFPFPHFDSRAPIGRNAVALLFCFPVIVGVLGLLAVVRWAIRREFRTRDAIFAFLLTWSVLFFCQALTRSDISHLLITLPPFFLLVVYCWRIVFERVRWPERWKTVAGGCVAILFFMLVWIAANTEAPDFHKASDWLGLDRGGVRMEQGQFVESFIRKLQASVPPDRAILSLPYQPMFYFLMERRNPTRWNYLWPGDQTPAEHQLLIDQAKQDRPAVVLLTGEKEMAKYAPAIVDFVQREYVKTGQQAKLSIYTERPGD